MDKLPSVIKFSIFCLISYIVLHYYSFIINDIYLMSFYYQKILEILFLSVAISLLNSWLYILYSLNGEKEEYDKQFRDFNLFCFFLLLLAEINEMIRIYTQNLNTI